MSSKLFNSVINSFPGLLVFKAVPWGKIDPTCLLSFQQFLKNELSTLTISTKVLYCNKTWHSTLLIARCFFWCSLRLISDNLTVCYRVLNCKALGIHPNTKQVSFQNSTGNRIMTLLCNTWMDQAENYR